MSFEKSSFEKGTLILRSTRDPKTKKQFQEQYEAACRMGCRQTWQVAEKYEIRDGILQPLSQRHNEQSRGPEPSLRWRVYHPINEKDLLYRLAKIKEGDEKALLAYAQKYGLLGFTNTLPFIIGEIHSRTFPTVIGLLRHSNNHPGVTEEERTRTAKKQVRETLASLTNLASQCGLPEMSTWKAWIESGGGDPLPWVWAHIRTLNLCLDLASCVNASDEDDARSVLRKYPLGKQPNGKDVGTSLEVALRNKIVNQAWAGRDGSTALDVARLLLCDLITPNIQHVSFSLQPEGKSLESYLSCASLIEMAYWHLLADVTGGVTRRCKECGKRFHHEDPRTQYCPNPKRGKQSRCGKRASSLVAMRAKRLRDKIDAKRKTSNS